MAKVGFDLINKDVHQANDYTGHGGPQHVAKKKRWCRARLTSMVSMIRSITSRP
jgi:hypothetical protein